MQWEPLSEPLRIVFMPRQGALRGDERAGGHRARAPLESECDLAILDLLPLSLGGRSHALPARPARATSRPRSSGSSRQPLPMLAFHPLEEPIRVVRTPFR